MGGGLKVLVKNTCEGVYLLVKLPPLSLKACKFPKNELLYTNVSIILGRFYYYCVFRFLEVFFYESFRGRRIHFSMWVLVEGHRF